MLYQMANEELQQNDSMNINNHDDGNDYDDEVEVGSKKRMREELTDMLEMSHELVKNMKFATAYKNDAVILSQKETLELEKQVVLRGKERDAILEFEAKRQSEELKYIDSLYTKKIQYERELKQITAPPPPPPQPCVIITTVVIEKESVCTIKSVSIEYNLKPSKNNMNAQE